MTASALKALTNYSTHTLQVIIGLMSLMEDDVTPKQIKSEAESILLHRNIQARDNLDNFMRKNSGTKINKS